MHLFLLMVFIAIITVLCYTTDKRMSEAFMEIKEKRRKKMEQYDYLLVGSGLYNAVFAYLAGRAGKKCLILEKRDHIGGNIYCEEIEGIHVHRYGAHIFHTSNRKVWDFVNSLAEFNRYTNSPVANYRGEMYNMPFNMNTFSKMWGISTPAEAKAKSRSRGQGLPESQGI